jgi:phosphoribosylformylglycinamidine (FGAM) synthase PurS component
VRIEIGLWDLCGKKHELTLDAEAIVDYNICKKLLRELWHNEIIGDYAVALVKEK